MQRFEPKITTLRIYTHWAVNRLLQPLKIAYHNPFSEQNSSSVRLRVVAALIFGKALGRLQITSSRTLRKCWKSSDEALWRIPTASLHHTLYHSGLAESLGDSICA
jgi:hypothetical protein